MLLHFDGLDVRWEQGVNYMTNDGQHSHEDMIIFRQHLSRVRNLTPITDFTLMGTAAVRDNFIVVHGESDVEYEKSYTVLQQKLIDHFAYQHSVNQIQWLKKKAKRVK
jgi:hypothetical protein